MDIVPVHVPLRQPPGYRRDGSVSRAEKEEAPCSARLSGSPRTHRTSDLPCVHSAQTFGMVAERSGSIALRISRSISVAMALRSEKESPAVNSASVLITKMRRAG